MTRGRIIAGIAGVTAALVLAVLLVSKVSSIKTGQVHNQQAAASTNNLCPGVTRLVTFDETWRKLEAINPALHCRIVAYFPPGHVEYADKNGSYPAIGQVGRNPVWARTTTGKAEVFTFSLCPPDRQNRLVNWDCSSL